MIKKYLLGFSALAAFATAPASAQTVFSENFESGYGVFSPSGQVQLATSSTYGPCCGTPADTSNTFVAFGGGNLPSGNILSTSFNTVLGTLYNVSFSYGAFGAGSESLTLQAGGTSFTVNPTANNTLSTFQNASFSFLGTGNATSLNVFSGGVANVDALIDNITVSAVPELDVWAMLIAGFGAVGFQMRRRAKLKVVTA